MWLSLWHKITTFLWKFKKSNNSWTFDHRLINEFFVADTKILTHRLRKPYYDCFCVIEGKHFKTGIILNLQHLNMFDNPVSMLFTSSVRSFANKMTSSICFYYSFFACFLPRAKKPFWSDVIFILTPELIIFQWVLQIYRCDWTSAKPQGDGVFLMSFTITLVIWGDVCCIYIYTSDRSIQL